MKLTKNNLIKLNIQENNRLYQRVYNYILSKWEEYDNKTAIFTDVLNNGCVSGIVSELIYTSECVEFYEKYQREINNILYENMEDMGIYNLVELFGHINWDKTDPLALTDHNKNILAWFGFEETLRNIARNFEELELLI